MNNIHIIYIRVFVLFMGLLFGSMVANAQQAIRRNDGRTGVRKDIPVIKKPTKSAHLSRKINIRKIFSVQDTVYSIRTKKQHGWFSPVRIITKEQASHRNYSYRFTNRNSQGKWCKMEIINGYGNYIEGAISPYILKLNSADTDSLADADWIEKLKTACINEFISDPSGENIIQERAYDKNMNIVYTFSRTPIGTDSLGHRKFVGAYKDFYGLPAEMRKDTTNTYTYGTLVMLTEDIWGNDSIVEYMDAKGRKKLNSDGVAMEVFICDKDGYVLKQQSRDTNGNLTIDNWGNCGWEWKWNINKTVVSAVAMDDKWHPMRIPFSREVNDVNGVIKVVRKGDEYYRDFEESYYTENDMPDTNLYGVHKICIKYDKKGNEIERSYFDLNNGLTENYAGTAKLEVNFDENGNVTDVIWLDKELRPSSKEGYLSRLHYGYDEKGNKVLEERYAVVDGKEVLNYKTENTPQFQYKRWGDGSYRVDSLDMKGRTVSTTFYDAQGNLEKVGNWAKEITTYLDGDKYLIAEMSSFDEFGNIVEVDGRFKYVNKIDSISHTEHLMRYTANGDLYESFIYKWNENFTKLLGEYDANAFGVVCRAGGTASVRHYVANVLYNQKGNFASLIGRDEYNEPDYIVCPNGLYYYQKLSTKGKNIFYDENSKPIDDSGRLMNILPKVMTIEVVDSSAYKLGLRDNDVILFYGDYSVNLDSIPNYDDFRKQWALRCVLDARKNKRMVVFRIEDAKQNKYGLVEIRDLVGTPSELGFLAHIRYLTQKQLHRINDAIEKNLASSTPLIVKDDLNKRLVFEGDNNVKIVTTEIFRMVRNKPYPKQIIDPAILIGGCIKDRNIYRDMAKGDSSESFEQLFNTRRNDSDSYSTMHLYFTKDMNGIVNLTSDEKWMNLSMYDIKVPNEDYVRLLELNKVVQGKMEKIKKEPSGKNNKK